MKQDAFIQQLRQGLASLPKQEVDEIVADYREYIGDAIAAGRNEEEVIAALGDPAKLAREIKAQATYRQWQARRSFGNLARVVASIAGLGLLNLILLLPFLIYLLLLTAGYMVSGAFAIGGLVTVVSLCSHHAFGWPPTEQPSIHISTKSNHAASATSSTAKNASDEAPDFGDGKSVKVEHAGDNDSTLVWDIRDDDDNVVRIVAPMGWGLGAMTFRYVHRQIDALSARLDEQEPEQPS